MERTLATATCKVCREAPATVRWQSLGLSGSHYFVPLCAACAKAETTADRGPKVDSMICLHCGGIRTSMGPGRFPRCLACFPARSL